MTGEGQLNARRELASIQTILQDSSEDSCLQSLPPALSPSPGRVQTPPCSSIKKWCLHSEQEQTPTGAGTGYTRIPRITELRHSPARHLTRLLRLCAGLGGLTPQVLLCTHLPDDQLVSDQGWLSPSCGDLRAGSSPACTWW